MSKKGIVYLLADTLNDGLYKIGVTTGTIDKRISKLQTGNAGEIYACRTYETDYPFMIEKKLHRKYTGANVLNEWFKLSDDEVERFSSDCQKEEKAIEALKDNPFFSKYLK